ncbi:MAG TPA: hypothetical protein VFQ43_17365, partial [Nitrososphaera sp.]|nr:hypothetical protein [Nitrososphaera sp.]
MKSTLAQFALVSFMIFILTAVSVGQGPQTGTIPFGSFAGGPETINLVNNNLMWTIPIRHKPGRGTNFDYDLSYNSSIWMPVTSGSTTTWQPIPGNSTVVGWQGLAPAGNAYIRYLVTYSTGTCGQFGDH